MKKLLPEMRCFGSQDIRDCAIIIIRRGTKNQKRGEKSALSENNDKIRGGAQIKITLITGGLNFHFMSCAFALNCKKIPHAL